MPSAILSSQVLITMIVFQLLATCFTLPQGLSAYSSPSTSYKGEGYSDAVSSNPRLVSSLKLHAQFRRSPTLGHHGRDVSVAQPWPNMYVGSSHEEHLARATSQRRKPRPGTGIADRVSGDGEGGFESEHFPSAEVNPPKLPRPCGSEESIDTRPNIPTYNRRRDRVFGRPRRFVGTPPTELSRSAMTDYESSVLRPGHHRALHIDRRDDGRRWSLQPVLRSEAHPVFVQPVKEYVIRRWRTFCSEQTSGSSSCVPDVRKTGRAMKTNSGDELTADIAVPAHSEEASMSSDSENSLLDMASVTFTIAEPCIESEESVSRGHSESLLHSPPLITMHRRSYSEKHSIGGSNAPMCSFPPCNANPPTPLRTFQFNGNRSRRTSSSGTLVFRPRIADDSLTNDTGFRRKSKKVVWKLFMHRACGDDVLIAPPGA